MAFRSPLGGLRFLSSRLPFVRAPGVSRLRPRAVKRRAYSGAGRQDAEAASSRASRILSRLPPSMRKYTDRLRNAPVSHVVAFLVLHELTAIVPLVGLFGFFHYTDYVPIGYMLENYGSYVRDGAIRFERYFRKKGWLGEEDRGAEDEGALDLWQASGRYKMVVEVALAYAITKVLLPVRIIGSVWATPWFAGVLIRMRRLVWRS